MPVSSALFLSRLESRDLVCTVEEHIGAAFADALGGETSQAALDTRAQMVDEKPANEHKKLNLGPNASLFLLRQRVIYEMAAGGFDFAAATARCLVRALQRSGCSSLQELVEMTGASVSAIESLKWEGLDSHGHVQQDGAVTAKNGESLLALRDRSILARWGQKLQVAKDDAARAAAAAAADAAAAAKEVPVDQGADVAALAPASGYGA